MMIKYANGKKTTTIDTLGVWRGICRKHGVKCQQLGKRDDALDFGKVLESLRLWRGWIRDENIIYIFAERFKKWVDANNKH